MKREMGSWTRFHHQSTSAKAGKTATVAISGFRMWEPNQASLAVSKGDDCYIPTNGRDDVIAFLKYDATVSTATEYTFSAFIPADAKGKSRRAIALAVTTRKTFFAVTTTTSDDTTNDRRQLLFSKKRETQQL